MKKTMMVLLVLLLVVSLAGCSEKKQEQPAKENKQEQPAKENKQEQPAAEKKEVLKVAMECGYPPYNWTQKDNSNGAIPIEGSSDFANGYDVQIAKLIGEGLGREVVAVQTIWDGMIPSLQSGVVDVVIAGMSPTAERAKEIDFSSPYYNIELVMVVKKGGAYEKATSLKDFSGAKVTAQQGTLHYNLIDQIEGVQKEVAFEDFPTMRMALKTDMIDGYVSEKPEGISASQADGDLMYIELNPGFKVSDEDRAISVGLKKGSPLLADINKVVEGISEEKRIELMTDALKNQPSIE